jgi:short-subunit dehydrogenase
MASLQPTPGHGIYGATKAFVTSFSESLHEEARGQGIGVTAVLPGYTRTEFHLRATTTGEANVPDRLWQTADACAAEALAGLRAGRATVVTGRVNQVVAIGSALVPRAAKRRLVRSLSGRFR